MVTCAEYDIVAVPGYPMLATATIGGFFVGQLLENYNKQLVLQREMIVQDYIQQHPDDFPEIGTCV